MHLNPSSYIFWTYRKFTEYPPWSYSDHVSLLRLGKNFSNKKKWLKTTALRNLFSIRSRVLKRNVVFQKALAKIIREKLG